MSIASRTEAPHGASHRTHSFIRELLYSRHDTHTRERVPGSGASAAHQKERSAGAQRDTRTTGVPRLPRPHKTTKLLLESKVALCSVHALSLCKSRLIIYNFTSPPGTYALVFGGGICGFGGRMHAMHEAKLLYFIALTIYVSASIARA